MAKRPVLLVHGYSDEGASYARWIEILRANGYAASEVHSCSYVSLANEISLSDLAEGFDRAVRHLADGGVNVDEFDVFVHSTGMLVLRRWLASAPEARLPRVKHIVALAPATFGSPLAHKGRSWLGAIFKGNKTPGPDFMEAGDDLLDALELGSRIGWDLAALDLFSDRTFYSAGGRTPYVFVFCGDRGYTGLQSLLGEPGTDGTVRWAGCAVNSRKIVVDLTTLPEAGTRRIDFGPWRNNDSDLVPVAGANHSTVLRKPSEELVGLALSALEVTSRPKFEEWKTRARATTASTLAGMKRYQQFVVHAIDERGDGISDFNIQLFARANGSSRIEAFTQDVHVYSGSHSFRCFHVDVSRLLDDPPAGLWLQVIASSGSALVGYHGFGSEKVTQDGTLFDRDGKWDGKLDLTELVNDTGIKFFYPFTTTFLEVRLNREPLPLSGRNRVLWFDGR